MNGISRNVSQNLSFLVSHIVNNNNLDDKQKVVTSESNWTEYLLQNFKKMSKLCKSGNLLRL
jgi:hypothetical protein